MFVLISYVVLAADPQAKPLPRLAPIPQLADTPPPPAPLSAGRPIPDASRQPSSMLWDRSTPAAQPPNRPVVANGCGSDSSWFKPSRTPASAEAAGAGTALLSAARGHVPQRVSGADFTPACNAHDLCWSCPWASKAACDRAFLTDLRRACMVPAVHNPLRCLEAAEGYAFGVRHFGHGPFDDAQLGALRGSTTPPTLFGGGPALADKFTLSRESPPARHSLGVDLTLTPSRPGGWPPPIALPASPKSK
ncbi:MAG: hypothetical protein ABGY75_15350 [Gemmataceae bacterium]